MAIQFCINNIYKSNYAWESAIRHNIILLRCDEWQKRNYLDIFSRPNAIPNC